MYIPGASLRQTRLEAKKKDDLTSMLQKKIYGTHPPNWKETPLWTYEVEIQNAQQVEQHNSLCNSIAQFQ